MTLLEKRAELIQLFGAYGERLERLYDGFIDRLVFLGYDLELLEQDALFNFANFPELQGELDAIFNEILTEQMLTFQAAITDGVALAFTHDAAMLGGESVLSQIAVRKVRDTVAKTFIRNRLFSPKGLNLSQLVWNYLSQAKTEFEAAMSNVISEGLEQGTSAEELGRKVRQELNAPDMMYRRYHEKVVMSDGSKKDIAVWRKRVIDEDGKVRFVKAPLENVGMGHYRSARKNALRLMRTEINMAYHVANHERWQQEPFVIGQRISLSPQHPEEDICDVLAGDYPKDFLFIGWHTQCLCMATAITLQGKERTEFHMRKAKGEDMSNYQSPNRVKDVPEAYKQYVAENADKILSADERGKLAWHFDVNRQYWENIVEGEFARQDKVKQAREQFDSYGDGWNRAYYNEQTGGFNVYHANHQFSDNRSARENEDGKIIKARLTGGEAEKEVGRILADIGKRVEYLPESSKLGKKPDLAFEGQTWDVKYIPLANCNTIRKAIEDARKADNAIFYWDESNQLENLKQAINRTVGKFRNDLASLPNIYYINQDNKLCCIYKKRDSSVQ